MSRLLSTFRAALIGSSALFALALAMATLPARAQNVEEMRDYQEKAECLRCFARFVEWPEQKLSGVDAPLIIGVFGAAENFAALLHDALSGRFIKGRPVLVVTLQSRDELRSCHVAFISRSERDQLAGILEQVRLANVLTVGESDNFLAMGGMIQFLRVGSSLRFQINPAATAREKLTVSSKLLQLSATNEPPASQPRDPTSPISDSAPQVTTR